MVVAAHAGAHPLSDAPAWAWVAGRLGVTLFFVISGFIMVIVSGSAGFDGWRFIRARILRIVPIYWAVTLLTAAASILIPSVFHKTVFSISHLVGSLFFIPMLRPGNPGMIEPFVKLGWTLNYEIFFYVCFAALCFLSSYLRVLILFSFFAFLVIIGQYFQVDVPIAKFYTSYDLTGFMGGIVLGLMWQRGLLPTGSRIFAVTAIGIFGLLFISLFIFSDTKVPRVDRQICIVAACILLLTAAICLENIGSLPKGRITELLGEASYSIYLMHMFAIGAAAVFSRRFYGDTLSLSEYLVVLLAGMTSGIILGWFTYLAVERPLTQFFHRLSRFK